MTHHLYVRLFVATLESLTIMKERSQHCCPGPSGARRRAMVMGSAACSSCDSEEMLDFAAADSFTYH